MNAHDLMRALPARTYPSESAYRRAVRRAIERTGHHAIRAHYDAAGNCIICGECGRCPGWHFQSEVTK